MPLRAFLIAFGLLAACGSANAQSPASGAPKKVSDLLKENDRRLIRELTAYIQANPKAEDLDQAYVTLFERVIENDWFLDYEKLARSYLTDHVDGAVRPLARIVAVMARAQDSKFSDALDEFKALLKGLDRDDQEEFASNFADSLANAAAVAGEFGVSRSVYESLLARFAENPKLRDKVKDDLARLDMVGKAAPTLPVRDLKGVAFRFSEYKGKYVLVDFWASWCAPCVADLPNLQAAYKTFHDRGFEVVSISLDETIMPLNDFLKTHAMPWRQVHNATSGGDMVDAFGVNNIPASFLIDPEGKIIRLELRGTTLAKVLGSVLGK